MLALLTALSTPLAAQAVIAVGFAATLGTSWQIEAGEFGLVRRTGGGIVRALSAGVRVGSFVDQGAFIGGARGFVTAGVLSARTQRATIAEFGSETNVTKLGLDVTMEAGGYLAANSPLAIGSRWGAVALLPGVRAGGDGGAEYALVFGPTVFFGRATEVRGLLAFRVEAPLARRERRL